MCWPKKRATISCWGESNICEDGRILLASDSRRNREGLFADKDDVILYGVISSLAGQAKEMPDRQLRLVAVTGFNKERGVVNGVGAGSWVRL